MFSLLNGKLVRINKNGSDGEIYRSKNTSMLFGTSILDDYRIKDIDSSTNVSLEIFTDEYGRVSDLLVYIFQFCL